MIVLLRSGRLLAGLGLALLLTAPAAWAQPGGEPEVLAYWAFNEPESGSWPSIIVADIGTGSLTYNINNPHGQGGTTLNAPEDYPAGRSFAPVGSSNNGNHFEISFSSEGYEDVVISYATQGTGTGFNEQVFEYSIDNGTTFVPVATVTDIPTNFAVRQVNLPAEAANQAELQVRVTVDGATSGSGNNRFDNLLVMGAPVESSTPTVHFTSASGSVVEGGVHGLDVELVDPDEGGGEVTVSLIYTDNSGDIASVTPLQATLSITNPTAAFEVATNGNEVTEGTRDIEFTIVIDGDAELGSPYVFTLTILDDDAAGGGFETFENLDALVGSYRAGSYIGDDGIEWEYSGVRSATGSQGGPPISGGRSVGFGTSDNDPRYVKATVEGGVGKLSWKQRSYFTRGNASHRTIEVFVNGISQGSFTLADMDVVEEYSIEVNVSGIVDIEFWAIGTSSTMSQIMLDDVAWTGYGPGAVTATLDGERGWRFLSSPSHAMRVQHLVLQNLVQGIPGEYPDAAANLYLYDATGYVEPEGKHTLLEAGRGFIWYLYNNNSNPHDDDITSGESQSYELPFTLRSVGAVPGDDVEVTTHSGWNLLGNPFSRAIDLDQMAVEGGSLRSIIGQVWDPDTPGVDGAGVERTGSYVLTSDPDDSEVPNVLGVWQGAFFQNDDATSVTFPVDARIDGETGPFYGRPGGASEVRRIGFELASATTYDRALMLYFSEGGQEGWDLWDAAKLTPFSATYATLAFVGERGGREVLKAQESRPLEPGTFSVPLAFEAAGAEGPYTLRWPRWHNVPADWTIMLEDLVTGATVDLRAADSLTFTASATRPAQDVDVPRAQSLARSSDARFVLHVTAPRVGAEDGGATPEAFALEAVYPNPLSGRATVAYALPEAADVRLAVYDLLGREVAVLVDGPQEAGRHRAAWAADGLAAGVYVLRLTAGTYAGTAKAVVMR